jgi:hypothetical protein
MLNTLVNSISKKHSQEKVKARLQDGMRLSKKNQFSVEITLGHRSCTGYFIGGELITA